MTPTGEENLEYDELLGHYDHPKATPRESSAMRSTPTVEVTPYTNLRQLAGLIRTEPMHENNENPSIPATSYKTSTPGTARRPYQSRQPLQNSSGNRSNPTTPHAIRAHRVRRNTPGLERRKSGKMQRETPRDTLRNLSKVLAPTSQPIKPSPPAVNARLESVRSELLEEDLEDELHPPEATLDIFVDENADSESSSLLVPPRLSIPFEDGDLTAKSIEISRKAAPLGDFDGRMSRGSVGTTRFSEYFENVEDVGNEGHNGDDDSVPPFDIYVDNDIDQPSMRNTLAASDDMGDISEHLGTNQTELESEYPLAHRDSSTFVLELPDVYSSGQEAHKAIEQPHVLPPQSAEPAEQSEPSEPSEPSKPSESSESSENEDARTPDLVLSSKVNNIQKRPRAPRAPKTLKTSRYGKKYPSFPSSVAKSVVLTMMRSMGHRSSRLNKEVVEALVEASDRFFEQLGDDLEVLSKHAGRKTIDDADMIALMQRQRKVSVDMTPFFLAAHHLPGELLKDIATGKDGIVRKHSRHPLQSIEEEPSDIGL